MCPNPADGRFPTTHWTLVARAGQDPSQSRREALGQLLGRYLPALRAHLIHGRRLSPDDADDLLQDFVAAKIIEKDLIGRADRELGRFRTYLMAAIDRFLIDQFRQRSAKKRSPGDAGLVALGDQAGQVADGSPSDAFETQWAREVIAQATRMMRQECQASARMEIWGVFECRLLRPLLEGTEPADYDELVERFGLRSPSQASNVLMTAKRMFGRMLKSVIGEYAVDEEEIESEIRDLHAVLARSRT